MYQYIQIKGTIFERVAHPPYIVWIWFADDHPIIGIDFGISIGIEIFGISFLLSTKEGNFVFYIRLTEDTYLSDYIDSIYWFAYGEDTVRDVKRGW